MKDSFMVESSGDCSKAVYVRDGDEWVLALMVDPDPRDEHPWPERVTEREAARWRSSCVFRRVEWRKAVGVAL